MIAGRAPAAAGPGPRLAPSRKDAGGAVVVALPAATFAAHLRGSPERVETVLLLATAAAIAADIWWHRRTPRRARRPPWGLRHDLLGALTVIRGHVELHGRRRPVSSAEVHELREVVIDEIGRMTDRLDDLGDE